MLSQPLPPEHAARWHYATAPRVPDFAGQSVRARTDDTALLLIRPARPGVRP
ncbi:hypothetical protein [Streptomyces sp. NPDC091259]|uniref:hypothetical protein n=1 Tax=Streptomyces sp. NPDC091259 TaxID=3365976 RepID=UPI0038097D15